MVELVFAFVIVCAPACRQASDTTGPFETFEECALRTEEIEAELRWRRLIPKDALVIRRCDAVAEKGARS